jgi:hypothetical protein
LQRNITWYGNCCVGHNDTYPPGFPMHTPLALLRAALVAGALGASACSQAALVEYTSRAAFDAATTLRTVEQYSAPPGDYEVLSDQEYRGIVYPGFAYMVDPAYEPMLYEWGTGPVLLLDNESRLSFAPVNAFAADFGSLPVGVDLIVMIDGIARIIATPAARQLTFFGWTSSTPFSSVELYTSAQYLILDNVTRGNVRQGPPPPTGLPEPAPLAVIGLGVLALAARRRN